MSPKYLVVAFLACLASCIFTLHSAHAGSPPALTSYETIPAISAQEAKSLIMDKKPVFILDVRQKEEYDAGHIDNAVLIPLNSLPDHYKELPQDKKIVAYCHSGRRSALAVAFLRAEGFTDAVSMAGGYAAWQELR